MDTLLSIYGYALIGLFLSFALYGITLYQALTYYIKFYSNDKWFVQLWVVALLILETAFVATSAEWMFQALIRSFGYPERLVGKSLSALCFTAFSGLMIALVLIFHAWRIYTLMKSKWIAFTVVFGAVTCATMAIVCGILVGVVWTDPVDYFRIAPFLITWIVTISVTDILISSSLTWYLYKMRHQLFSETQSLVKNIMKATIQAALITTLFQLAHLFIYLFVPNGAFFVTIFLCPISFVWNAIASLNTRKGSAAWGGKPTASLDVRFASRLPPGLGHSTNRTEYDGGENDDPLSRDVKSLDLAPNAEILAKRAEIIRHSSQF